jgi:hypothetical protein
MRAYLLLQGLLIIGVGFAGKMMHSGRNEGFSFLQGGLTLGGALLICGLFAIKNPWHGMIGGGVVALIGFCRTMVNVPTWADWLSQPSPRSAATPLLEMVVALITASISIMVLRKLLAEKTRRMLEEDDA